MRFLIFGDVVGSLGRKGIDAVLPDLREELQPDAVIINIENIAHGKGISPQTVQEALTWKADVYTTGDHAWDNKAGLPILEDSSIPIIRPANYGPGAPGKGWHTWSIGAYQATVINMQGQVMFRNHPANPFHTIDALLEEPDIQQSHVVLLDFHAEATSEKRALGWYTDGRIAGIWGTHTHVPTADAQVLPEGTAYITDVGMNGAYHSIIGVDRKGPIKAFLTQIKEKMEPSDTGPIEVNAVMIDVDPSTRKATAIAQIRKILNDT
jgi:2',3'-cyclic-nucleotide 2'-phosphodiesterase